MTGTEDTWASLIGLAGLLNPVALLIGAALGWYADARVKIGVAAFGAACLSLVIDAAMRMSGAPQFAPEVGALAAFPFRFLGAGIAGALIYMLRGILRPRS
ncbi:phosphatidylglycerophosphatase [Pannonibacter sp. SL95]|uniref:phosphatidylglycerophosphatase n=1 Tax=Pannonibacter sp. SL95 TaxID=2995153 RepID=UPI002272FAF5|nr:phosphatidylglycerophosphatase [Pannonibacter sp. SL95]MCY1706008.1 phosphatidylglycerophosphatase [Pannonibacter sp. SL95]